MQEPTEQIERSIANQIIKDNSIYTLRETDEFCLYNGGYFHKGLGPLSEIREYINAQAKITEVPYLTTNGVKYKPYNLSISKRNAIIEIIKAESFTTINEFDKEPSIICVRNGLYNFDGFQECTGSKLLPESEQPKKKTLTIQELQYIKKQYPKNYEEKLQERIRQLELANTPRSKPIKTTKSFLAFEEYEKTYKDPYKTFIQIPVDYNSDAECLAIDQFLSDVFGFDTVPLIYEMLAYFLMPHIRYQKAFMLYGPPSTGKTTFITLITKFFNGLKYFSFLSLQEIGEKFELINLMLSILNVFDDLPDTPVGDTKAFRQVVTNDVLDSAVKHVPEHVRWRNRTKVLQSCNALPPVRRNEGDAFFRRWILIACFNTFKDKDMMSFEDEEDPTIKEKDYNIIEKICTPEEFSGLLNKIIEAWKRLEERGKFSKEWQDIEYIKNLWMIDVNPIGLFVNECCEIAEDNEVSKNLFWQVLNTFRKHKNAKAITKTLCTQRVKQLNGVEEKKAGKRKKQEIGDDRYWLGIKIKNSALQKYAPEYMKKEKEKKLDNYDRLFVPEEKVEPKVKYEPQADKKDYSDPGQFRI